MATPGIHPSKTFARKPRSMLRPPNTAEKSKLWRVRWCRIPRPHWRLHLRVIPVQPFCCARIEVEQESHMQCRSNVVFVEVFGRFCLMQLATSRALCWDRQRNRDKQWTKRKRTNGSQAPLGEEKRCQRWQLCENDSATDLPSCA